MKSAAHEDFSRGEAIRGSSDRSFGIAFAVVFAVIGVAPIFHGRSPRYWALGASVALLAVSLGRPSLLHPANYLWIGLARALNRIVSPIAMGLLFFLVATPTGFLMRLFGKDPLRLKFDPEAESYWLRRTPPGPPPESMANQF